MIIKLIKSGRILAFLPSVMHEDNPYDNVIVDKKGILNSDPNETGFQRLRNLFRPYENKTIHPEIVNIFQTSFASFLIGVVYGGVKSSRIAFINFIETNEATQFQNHLHAKRQLSDKMFTSFMKGGVRWGAKLSFFCTSFVVAYTAVSVYRNKDSVWYYTVGGMYAGTIYKFSLGPKGMISGAFFGSIFGTIYASMKYILLKMGNSTEEQLREHKFKFKTDREKTIKETEKRTYMAKETEQMAELMNNPKLMK